jgi:hypothetical protein
MRRKLDKLTNFPETEEEQVKNMQSILNYYKTAKQHDLQESAINFDFIQMYSGKLSRFQKKSLIDHKIETCVPFIVKIKDYQRTNLQCLHTTTTRGAKTFQYINRPGESGGREPNLPAGRQPGYNYKNLSGSGPRGQDGNPSGSGPRWPDKSGNGTLRGQKYEINFKCFICQEKHFNYNCPLLTL